MGRAATFAARVALLASGAMLAACQPSADDSAPEATATAASSDATIENSEMVDATQVVDAPFGAIRIEQISKTDGVHAEAGRLEITYLDEDKVVKSFPKAVELGSFGAMNEFHVDRTLSDNPVVISKGGGMWQGHACEWTVLTELRPSGPFELANYLSDLDDSGAIEDDPEIISSEITQMIRDQSFTVTFKGTRDFTALYVRNGEKGYKLQGSKDQQLTGC